MTNMLQNDAHATYVLSLTDIPYGNVECVGSKAAKLGELARAGFPVPDGFVLATSAFDRFLAANALGADSSPEAVAAATLPTDVVDALLAAAEALGDVPLAVRSSGVAEDLPKHPSPGSTRQCSTCVGRTPCWLLCDKSSFLPSVVVSLPTVLLRRLRLQLVWPFSSSA